MVRVFPSKSPRTTDLTMLESSRFHELINYIAGGNVELNEVDKLIESVNEELKGRDLRIRIRRATP